MNTNPNESSTSLIDKLFNRINRNKKSVSISTPGQQQAQAQQPGSSVEYEVPSLNEYLIEYPEYDSISNKNNLSLDLSTIREEDNLSQKVSDLNVQNLNLNDVFHKLSVTSYLTPTYCDYCELLLMGLIKQGLKCQICGLNFHKRCVPDMPKICNKQLSLMFNKASPSGNMPNKSFLINDNNLKQQQIEIEHIFIKKQHAFNSRLSSNLICMQCQSKIQSDKSFYQCKDCQLMVHPKCLKSVKKNCKPTNLIEEDQDIDLNQCSAMSSLSSSPNNDSKLNRMSLDEQKLESHAEHDQEMKAQKEEDSDSNESTLNDSNLSISKQYKQFPRKKKTQICLQRLSQRVKKTSGYFWSGHMFYYTNKNLDCVTHYWKLDSKSIIIYDSYRLEKKLKEIPLENIKRCNLCGLSINKEENCINEQKCLFVLITEAEVFYCGMGNADQNSTMNVLARNFYNIFKMVYLPYGNRYSSRASLKISAPKYEEKSLHEEYIINPQELLGSGQFGQVYGGQCKSTGQSVAIKVIDKTRFKDFQAETSIFQNEITILYNVQHPGIVKLFALFDEVDHLFIVTEKMSTDMLEMILNKKPPRLSERVAKFIIYQILIALNKLHQCNIAHCDLKPENILLTENVDFPQVKICDFGYAKIIGENSFRRSMVGTPAYSPPELKQKRLYNNSIDMWSMGVIVYVSLSGTFPFEEDRDIYEQIMNSNFMFPDDPWKNVSANAINLINSFLQVKIDKRMSVNKALQHSWFSDDFQLYLDLVDLENKVASKWLTTKMQEKWSQPIHL